MGYRRAGVDHLWGRNVPLTAVTSLGLFLFATPGPAGLEVVRLQQRRRRWAGRLSLSGPVSSRRDTGSDSDFGARSFSSNLSNQGNWPWLLDATAHTERHESMAKGVYGDAHPISSILHRLRATAIKMR